VFEGEYEDNLPVSGHYKWADGEEYTGYVSRVKLLDSGSTAFSTAKVSKQSQMDESMMEIGLMESLKDLGFEFMRMSLFMKDSGRLESGMEKESRLLRMELLMKVLTNLLKFNR